MDTASRLTVSATNNANGHQRTSTNDRICCAHAIGENQLSALPEWLRMSPTPRTTTAAANTPIAAPVAVRACRHNCTVTPATAPNTIAAPVIPRHIAAQSIRSKPVAANARVMVTAKIALTAPTNTSAANVRA
jgi:hypothetical protein